VTRRRLYSILAMLSLLLCLASAGLWIYGQWWWETFVTEHGSYGLWFCVEQNRLNFQVDHLAVGRFRQVDMHRHGSQIDEPLNRDTTGFQLHRVHLGNLTMYVCFLPEYALVLAFAAVSVFCGPMLMRQPTRLSGRCRNCGYDLRATPNRCPECGKFKSPAKPLVRRSAT
jgi:hypothetical protein